MKASDIIPRFLKKSEITDWWVAESDSRMAFVNILSGRPLSKNLLVVGYLDAKEKILGTSTNRVVEVTKYGVTTEKGTFYPFTKAHKLYLSFLIEACKENTLVATNWAYVDKWRRDRIIADIIREGNIEKGVTFDYTPRNNLNIMFVGYSKELSSNIVFTTFARRNICIRITIPEYVRIDIARSAWGLKKEIKEKVRLVQEIYAKKFE